MSKEEKKTTEHPEIVMDFETLSKLSGKSLKVISEELGVSKAFVTSSKTEPKILNKVIKVYLEKYEDILPLSKFLIEAKAK